MKEPINKAGSGPGDFSRLDRQAILRERERTLSRSRDIAAPITRVLPVHRTVRLGGAQVVARELRIGDLAQLQAWLEESDPDPMDGLPPAWADPDPETRPARLAAAWEAAETWPPRLFSEAGAALLATPAGMAFLMSLCVVSLRGDLVRILEILPDVAPVEWSAFERIAWGITPRAALAAELAPDRSPARAVDWFKALDWATSAEGGAGLSRAEFAALTLSEWRALGTGGKDPEHSPEFAGRVKRARAALGKQT